MTTPITALSNYESANDVLARLGMYRCILGNGRADYCLNGKTLFTGRIHEMWAWLEESGRVVFDDRCSPELDALAWFCGWLRASAMRAPGKFRLNRITREAV